MIFIAVVGLNPNMEEIEQHPEFDSEFDEIKPYPTTVSFFKSIKRDADQHHLKKVFFSEPITNNERIAMMMEERSFGDVPVVIIRS